jgi:hypothetical protein
MARIRDIAGPITSGPVPYDQPLSVATSRGPSMRFFPPTGNAALT